MPTDDRGSNHSDGGHANSGYCRLCKRTIHFARAHTHTHTHFLFPSLAHSGIHAHIHIRTHTHTHTLTHSHTYPHTPDDRGSNHSDGGHANSVYCRLCKRTITYVRETMGMLQSLALCSLVA